MTSTERPTPRSRPRPAADETVDPVISQPAPSSELPAVARRGPEPTVQLNVRVAGDVSNLIGEAIRTTGRTKRQLIEHAIRQTYHT